MLYTACHLWGLKLQEAQGQGMMPKPYSQLSQKIVRDRPHVTVEHGRARWNAVVVHAVYESVRVAEAEAEAAVGAGRWCVVP